MKKSLGAKTLIYPTPVLVVCTYDEEGKPNAMTVPRKGGSDADRTNTTFNIRAR